MSRFIEVTVPVYQDAALKVVLTSCSTLNISRAKASRRQLTDVAEGAIIGQRVAFSLSLIH